MKMTPKEYIQNVLKTESTAWEPIDTRLDEVRTKRLMHASLGIHTEGAELADVLKKYTFYGKPIDVVNLKEELGDVLFYLAIVCHEFGFTFEEAMEVNIAKLKKRYGEKFSEDKAINRNIKAEYEVLSGEKGEGDIRSRISSGSSSGTESTDSSSEERT